MKCPNCNRPLKKLKGKHKFAVNIPSSDKIFKETLEEHDKHCGCNEVHTKEEWKIKDYLALVKAIRKDAIDEVLKIIDNEKYSENDEWEETNEKNFQDAYNKACDDIINKLKREK